MQVSTEIPATSYQRSSWNYAPLVGYGVSAALCATFWIGLARFVL